MSNWGCRTRGGGGSDGGGGGVGSGYFESGFGGGEGYARECITVAEHVCPGLECLCNRCSALQVLSY